ncbi:HAMP domain-containing histidine kinase [bacterium]|nr:MAG: HAMP domain-containing histidine kinase [bacterium]
MFVKIFTILTFAIGFITPLAGIICLRSHGRRQYKVWIYLIGISLLWGLAGLSYLYFDTNIAIVSVNLIFILSLVISYFLYQRYKNNQAEVQRLKKLIEVRADQIAMLGHEIRTPLSLIKGSTELLIEGNPGPLTEQQSVFLNTISHNCEHLIALAEDLLIQAKIQAGLFKLHVQRVDLKSVVRLAVEQSSFLTEKKQQHFVTNYPQISLWIYADGRLILQALNNLILNASRHTSVNGHIYITLAGNDSSAVVTINDDGVGMSPEDRRNLFKKFTSGRPLGDGTGLGLVITKQIVELHGGKIMIDTSLGRGTTVLFSLPYWREEDEKTESTRGR